MMWIFKKNFKKLKKEYYLRGWRIIKENENLLKITKNGGLLKMILKMIKEY